MVDAEIVLKDELLFVDFHNSLEVNAVVEELHEWFNVGYV